MDMGLMDMAPTMRRRTQALLPALPQLLEVPQVEMLFPADVISRARHLLAEIPGGMGAYRYRGHGGVPRA